MSRSLSRSDSESRSPSEDSMALPSNPPPPMEEPQPQPPCHNDDRASPIARMDGEAVAVGAGAGAGADPNGAALVSLFIGLGPAARSIRADDLKKVLQDAASTPEAVLDVRMRGRCAFADVSTREEAVRLIAALDGQMFEDKARMAVQMSEHRREEAPRRGAPGPVNGGRLSLFVGLGPAGAGISDEEIKAKLEEAVPILALRRRGQCAFVEVGTPGDAEKLLRTMNNQYIGEARLAVQYSRESALTRKRERVDRRVGGRSGEESRFRNHRERSRSRERRTRRRRSESREHRRGGRRGRRSRSLTPSSVRSYSSYSSDRSRGGRRSRSYSSSRGSSVSHEHRDRRGRRDRRRVGGSRRP